MTTSKIAAGLSVATLLAGSLLAASTVPAAAAEHDSSQCGASVATPDDLDGWGPLDGVAPQYVDGPAGAHGNGSLRLTANSPADKVDYYHAASTSLADASGLGYRQLTVGAVQASFELKILHAKRTDGTAAGFTTLVWEPYRNDQPLGTTNGWVQESSIELGHWWSTRSIAGATGGQSQNVTLAEVAGANPDAVVTAYGVNLGKNNAVSNSYVNDVQFRCHTTNFKPGR